MEEIRNPRRTEAMEDERLRRGTASSDDEDEEANEDLSLRIIEKHYKKRAAKLNRDTDDDSTPSQPSPTVADSDEDNVVLEDYMSPVRVEEPEEDIELVDNMESQPSSEVEAAQEDNVQVVDNTGSQSSPATTAEQGNNAVLRKLLRVPRYFDPPGSNSNVQACFNCGEEGHIAVNCTSAFKKKKPCFVCGSLDHGARNCSKAKDCFICKQNGHRAKDCPEKHKTSSQMCLKCGDSGHDMFSCTNGYSVYDLKEVQCYICKSLGHLCCVDIVDPCPTEISCYKCGQAGHTGLACYSSRGESNTDAASPSSCYRCGETGHFARECSHSVKARKRNREPSTPKPKRQKEKKDKSRIKSAPPDLGKSRRKKKHGHEEKINTAPKKPKQRGGWMTEDPGDDVSQGNGKVKKPWRSSATPSSKGHPAAASSTPYSKKHWTPAPSTPYGRGPPIPPASSPYGRGNPTPPPSSHYGRGYTTPPASSLYRRGYPTPPVSSPYSRGHPNLAASPPYGRGHPNPAFSPPYGRGHPIPSTSNPYGKGHPISALTANGSVSSPPQPYGNRNFHQNRYSASRFDNSYNDGYRRNYDWW